MHRRQNDVTFAESSAYKLICVKKAGFRELSCGGDSDVSQYTKNHSLILCNSVQVATLRIGIRWVAGAVRGARHMA